MTNFLRGWVAASGVAFWIACSTAVYAQSGAANNPLRGNQQPARNQPARDAQPRVAAQPSGSADIHPRLPAGSGELNAGAGQRPGGVLPNGQPAQPVQLQIQPPFVLTPQEQADLDKLLADWEAQSDKIKSFKCSFKRWEYNPAFAGGNPGQATTESEGEIKYYAPDKGLFRVTNSWDNVPDPKTGKFQKTPEKPGEYWTCTGKSIFEVNHLNKTVEEHPLPPHLQGKAITEGPLPFVFGAKATVLNQRYFLRITTPPSAANQQVWLEAIPKTRQGAANFSSIDLILNKQDLLPAAMQIHDPGANANNRSRTVINFLKPSVNNPWLPIQQIFNDFAKPDYPTYKHVVVQLPGPAAAQAPPPGEVQTPNATQPPRQALVPQSNVR